MKPKLSTILFVSILIFLILPKVSLATTITAASCNQVDVQAAIDQAQDGDTVLVPEGECTWRTSASNNPSIVIPEIKGIILKGAGIDKTIITDGTGTGWNEMGLSIRGKEGKSFRITGFTFIRSVSGDSFGLISISGTSKNFRIDHNKFVSASRIISISGHTYGVIDHNQFILTEHTNAILVDEGCPGEIAWSRPLSLGSENAVYVEDNEFMPVSSTVTYYTMDSSCGGRYVFRYNTIDNAHVSLHGTGHAGGGRGAFSYEVYNNTIKTSVPTYRAMSFSGSTGVIFNNTIIGPFTMPIGVTYYRSCCGTGFVCQSYIERCDGNSSYDGNTPGMMGYPCFDQIGRSTNQYLEPLYEWNNTINGQDADIQIHNPSECNNPSVFDHIKENRDYYNDTPRPGYTPYTYPHPFITDCQNYPMLCDADATPPAPPKNLRIE